jgi:hypothetical protein
MNTNSRRNLWLVAFLAAGLNILGFTSAHAAAKKSLDFSKFKGTYSGSWSIAGSGFVYPGSVSVRVLVPKNGKKMTLLVSGTVNVSGSPYPISTTLTFFAKTRKLVSDAFLMGFATPIATNTTRFTGRGPFQATLTAAPGANLVGTPISGSIPYAISITRHTLSIQGSGIIDTGSPLPVAIAISTNK